MSLIKDISREDYSARLRMLYHALTNLRKLAYKKRSVVVCVNEVRSRMFSRGVKSSSDSSFEDLSDLKNKAQEDFVFYGVRQARSC